MSLLRRQKERNQVIKCSFLCMLPNFLSWGVSKAFGFAIVFEGGGGLRKLLEESN